MSLRILASIPSLYDHEASLLQYIVCLTMLLRIAVHPGSMEQESALERRTIHHISVNTGTKWTLGRKNANLEVKQDKTVSREHIAVSFVTTNNAYPEIPQASTGIERKACDKREIGVILQNSGKLGTFLVIPAETNVADTSMNKNDDGGDSDATEDEMESQYFSQASRSVIDVVLSPVSKYYTPRARLEPVALNETIALEMQDKPIIIQCGKFGTTVIITRIRLDLVCSGDSKAVIAELPLYRIGGTTMEDVANHTTNYMITPTYAASSKQLSAWCFGIPFVTDDYIKAWLDRKAPNDPIPQINDYLPASDGQEFWKTRHNPARYRSYTLLLTEPPEPNEYERLCQAAGIAHAVALYNEKGILSDEKVKELVTEHCFFIDSRRKIAKLLTKLKLPSVTGKILAKAITEQRLLTDKKGNDIAPADISVESEQRHDENPVDDSKKAVDCEMDTSAKSIQEESSQTSTRTSVLENEKSKSNEEVFCTAPQSEESKQEGVSPMEIDIGDSFPEPDDDANAQPPPQEPPVKRIRVIEDDTITSVSRGEARQTIATTTGGWLQALPQGRERQKYQRSVEEIKEMTGVEQLYTTATEIVSGLVRQPVPQASTVIEEDTGPNYKAFRKNAVPPPLMNVVELVSVAPESDRTATIGAEEEDQAIEEQQRLADELFRDPRSTLSSSSSRKPLRR